ncbi:hypothetical protein BH10ACI2_BH10ACI2_03200 [soil metagenome]
MPESRVFPYISVSQTTSPTDLMPYAPLSLSRGTATKKVFGLLDSGAMVSVLPYEIGLELGAVWENQTPLFQLGGNLANYESRGLILDAEITGFEPVSLAFAWTKAEKIPVILGQTNFFSSFDVCFFRQKREFEIKLR